jgi:hypothetical protein
MWTVPKKTDKERTALSQNSNGEHGLAPSFKGSETVFSYVPNGKPHVFIRRLFRFCVLRPFHSLQADNTAYNRIPKPFAPSKHRQRLP